MDTHRATTAVYTAFALAAFAANSVLCRLALGQTLIDAASFATIRLVCGALALLLLAGAFKKAKRPRKGATGHRP